MGFGVGGFWMFIITALIVVAVVLVLTRLSGVKSRKDSPAGSKSDAIAVLEMRYARSEITHEQFLEMRATLEQ